MLKHYHNTTPDNPNNITLMYVTNFGWQHSKKDINTDCGEYALMQVIAEPPYLVCNSQLDSHLRDLCTDLMSRYADKIPEFKTNIDNLTRYNLI